MKEKELIEQLNSVSLEEAKNIKEDWLSTAKGSMKWSWIFFALAFALFFVLYLMNLSEKVSPESDIELMKYAYIFCPIIYVFSSLYGINGYRAVNSLKIVQNGYTSETKKIATLTLIPGFIFTLPFVLIVNKLSNKQK